MSAKRPAVPAWRREISDAWTDLTTWGPSVGRRWHLALQAALIMAVPVVALALAGRSDIALFAATGAFAVLYGGQMSPRERARFVPLVAIIMFVAAALGVASAALGHVATSIGIVLVTVAAAALCYGWRVGPPGPIFPVLVFGLSAHLTDATATHRIADPVVYLTVVAASVCFAWLVTLAAWAFAPDRREPARTLRAMLPGPRWDAEACTLLVRAVAVALVGAGSALYIDPPRAYWIVCAGLAVVGLRAGRRITLRRGIHRAVGTVLGAGVYLALAWVAWPVAVLGLILGLLQFAIELVVVRHYALALCLITPLVLLIIGAGGASGWGLALERVIDTFVGVAIGVLAGLLRVRSVGTAR